MLVGWITACSWLYHIRDEFLSKTFTEEPNWLYIFVALYAISYCARIASKAIQASHSLSVKKLSIQNGEVELDGIPESSILNKYLDEIIYFFEENKRDIVVFEDLDRFGKPDIFVKLREINKIINDRPARRSLLNLLKPRQPLKFIYAIKDDMFLNKDRAKFFDFIIPIIPIINNSNSREMLAQSVKPKGSTKRISDQFITEVSIYLDDYRLIKNISNEFLIYERKINSGKLNLNKLLAAIIYKNAYPQDFESLHHGTGMLYEVVQKRASIISEISTTKDNEIEKLRLKLTDAENETCDDQTELIKIFWGHITSSFREINIIGIYASQELIYVEQIFEWDNFKKIFDESNVHIQGRTVNNSHERKYPLSKSFKQLESECSPKETFSNRYKNIKNKGAHVRLKANSDIERLKIEKAELPRLPLHSLLKINGYRIEEKNPKEKNTEDLRLINYLIWNGHLDETYNSYISFFHEGRMSRNDWEYIVSIRDFRLPSPDMVIDHPNEVISEMRRADFGSEFALNVNLIDHIISHQTKNHSQLADIIEFIAKNLSKADEFFKAYWVTGKHIEELTNKISELWPEYGTTAIDNSLAPKHIATIVAKVDPSYIAEKMNYEDELRLYLSRNAKLVFSENLVFSQGYHALELLGVKIDSLESISELDQLLEYVHNQSTYAITESNIRLLLSKFAQSTTSLDGVDIENLNFDSCNYTTIIGSGSSELNNYLSREINTYLKSVACTLERNCDEQPIAIVAVLNNPKADYELAVSFLLKQNTVFDSLEDMPQKFWGDALTNEKVETSWENIFEYFNSEAYEEDKLNEILDNHENTEELSNYKIPNSDESKKEKTLALCAFISRNEIISLENYKNICTSIPYTYGSIPSSLPEDRQLTLISLNKIRLTETSFNETSNSINTRTQLIERNFFTYKSAAEKFPISSDIKERLISSNISNIEKDFLIKNISQEEISNHPGLGRCVGKFLSNNNPPSKSYNTDLISYCLAHSDNPQTKLGLLYNFIDILPNEDIKNALSLLPEPYHSITEAKKRPKIENNQKNTLLAEALVRKKIISSINISGDTIQINTFR